MRPRAIICGSYYRDLPGLQRLFRELEATGCRVLAPVSIEFSDTQPPIVRTEDEAAFSVDDLERWFLRTLRSADFVVLHAPEGYIGISGAFEIGYADAIDKPIYTLQTLNDPMLSTRVHTAGSVFEILDRLQLISF